MAAIPEDKKRAYFLFLAVVRAAVIHITFALMALVSFAFGHVLSVFLGFVTLAVGTLVVLIDFFRRSDFSLSLVVLGVAVLITAVNLS
jgi:hypothetical protein